MKLLLAIAGLALGLAGGGALFLGDPLAAARGGFVFLAGVQCFCAAAIIEALQRQAPKRPKPPPTLNPLDIQN